MKLLQVLALVAALAIPSLASAHTPLFNCFDNGDGTISCEGGYSNGNSAAGTTTLVKDGAGKVVQTLKLDENGGITLDKPKGDYSVTMDGGEGHQVEVKGKDIVE